MPRLRIHFDGGCRPNPGAIEVAVVVRGITTIRDDLGHGDCQDAEWLALIEAATTAVQLGAQDVEFIGDSASVIAQAAGRHPCRIPRLRAHLAAFSEIAVAIPRIRLRHVARSHNLAGIALARRHAR